MSVEIVPVRKGSGAGQQPIAFREYSHPHSESNIRTARPLLVNEWTFIPSTCVALVPVGPRTTSPDLLSLGRATYVVVLALTSTSDFSSRLRRIRRLSCHRTQIRAGLYLGCVMYVQYLCDPLRKLWRSPL
jgi:hypothetical protein